MLYFTFLVLDWHRTCTLMFLFWPSGKIRMHPGIFEMTNSLLLFDKDADCCFSSQTRRHVVSRQLPIQLMGSQMIFLVSITHLALTFHLYEMAVRVVVFELYHTCTLMFLFWRSSAARMYPCIFEMMTSVLLSDVDNGRCFSSQTRRHDVSRQVSNSVIGESGELLVSITHPAFTFYLYEISILCYVFDQYHTCTLMFLFWPSHATRM
jgi:hypothetical protein